MSTTNALISHCFIYCNISPSFWWLQPLLPQKWGQHDDTNRKGSHIASVLQRVMKYKRKWVITRQYYIDKTVVKCGKVKETHINIYSKNKYLTVKRLQAQQFWVSPNILRSQKVVWTARKKGVWIFSLLFLSVDAVHQFVHITSLFFTWIAKTWPSNWYRYINFGCHQTFKGL